MGERSASDEGGEAAGPQDGIRRHLAEAYDACAEGLFRYAAILLADPAAAEDAVQQALAKFAALGARADGIVAPAAYLRRSVRNECYGLLRQRTRRRTIAGLPSFLEAAPAPGPEAGEELRQALERALRELPPEQREVVHMKVYEKMTFQQIADSLAISINTAASRYRYALAQLRERLGPYAEEQE